MRTAGYLVVEVFASAAEVAALRQRAEQLVDGFDTASVASVFSTKNQVRWQLHPHAGVFVVLNAAFLMCHRLSIT